MIAKCSVKNAVMTMTIADLAVHFERAAPQRDDGCICDDSTRDAARRSGVDLNKVRDVHHDTEVPHLKLHRGLDHRSGGLA